MACGCVSLRQRTRARWHASMWRPPLARPRVEDDCVLSSRLCALGGMHASCRCLCLPSLSSQQVLSASDLKGQWQSCISFVCHGLDMVTLA